jgi:hypothetical protein
VEDLDAAQPLPTPIARDASRWPRGRAAILARRSPATPKNPAIAEFLITAMTALTSGGIDERNACGRMTRRRFCPKVNPRALERLATANRHFADRVREADAMAALAADDAFHGILVEASGNPVVARLIPQLHPQVHRILYRKFSSLVGGRDTIDHHEEVMARCVAGDAEGAAALSAAHWARLGGLISELFDTDQLRA